MLLGKFQTDELESRFGYNRQLSRGNNLVSDKDFNYLVSVKDFFESEKNLKVISLLNIF